MSDAAYVVRSFHGTDAFSFHTSHVVLYLVFPLNVHRKILVKEKLWCRSGIPLTLSSLSNFEFFFAFMILEIQTGHEKKSRESFFYLQMGKSSEKKKNVE